MNVRVPSLDALCHTFDFLPSSIFLTQWWFVRQYSALLHGDPRSTFPVYSCCFAQPNDGVTCLLSEYFGYGPFPPYDNVCSGEVLVVSATFEDTNKVS